VQARQSIPHATLAAFYGILRANVRRLRPELWQQRNWLLHRKNAPSHISFYTAEFLTKNQHDYRPQPTLVFSVSPIEDKTERPPF
jgi:hypothetical protein